MIDIKTRYDIINLRKQCGLLLKQNQIDPKSEDGIVCIKGFWANSNTASDAMCFVLYAFLKDQLEDLYIMPEEKPTTPFVITAKSSELLKSLSKQCTEEIIKFNIDPTSKEGKEFIKNFYALTLHVSNEASLSNYIINAVSKGTYELLFDVTAYAASGNNKPEETSALKYVFAKKIKVYDYVDTKLPVFTLIKTADGKQEVICAINPFNNELDTGPYVCMIKKAMQVADAFIARNNKQYDTFITFYPIYEAQGIASAELFKIAGRGQIVAAVPINLGSCVTYPADCHSCYFNDKKQLGTQCRGKVYVKAVPTMYGYNQSGPCSMHPIGCNTCQHNVFGLADIAPCTSVTYLRKSSPNMQQSYPGLEQQMPQSPFSQVPKYQQFHVGMPSMLQGFNPPAWANPAAYGNSGFGPGLEVSNKEFPFKLVGVDFEQMKSFRKHCSSELVNGGFTDFSTSHVKQCIINFYTKLFSLTYINPNVQKYIQLALDNCEYTSLVNFPEKNEPPIDHVDINNFLPYAEECSALLKLNLLDPETTSGKAFIRKYWLDQIFTNKIKYSDRSFIINKLDANNFDGLYIKETLKSFTQKANEAALASAVKEDERIMQTEQAFDECWLNILEAANRSANRNHRDKAVLASVFKGIAEELCDIPGRKETLISIVESVFNG